ncbi:hypothetical protein GQ600_10983 [Phytophthora cactorum]|nr:hypothetical protein GQ600_10983 [Phytophthora cactorum]
MMLPVKLITKESELQSFLDKNENTFTPSETPTVGVHFQVAAEHQSDANQKEPDQVVAIVISSDVPSEVAVVLVLASLSKNRIITGLKALLTSTKSRTGFTVTGYRTPVSYNVSTYNYYENESMDLRGVASKPLSEKLQRSLAQTAKLYASCYSKIPAPKAKCTEMTSARWELAVINEGHPASWFDPAADNQPRSLECLISSDGGAPAIELPTLELQCELDSLLDLLQALIETPSETIDEIIANLGGEMHIGDDNRAGIDRQLHRISVYGLTMRVGRALRNAACVLTDLLLSDRHADKSVLTTLIRDVARCVSETMENVCIIDTSNEIGGDGLVPHECVGGLAAFMVPSLEAQAGVMVECVQNHTVETLIVDEIARSSIDCKCSRRLRALIKNPYLKGLVGGSQQTQRASNPIFDVIVELDHVAVVSVLECNGYSFETRRWDASTQGVQVST